MMYKYRILYPCMNEWKYYYYISEMSNGVACLKMHMIVIDGDLQEPPRTEADSSWTYVETCQPEQKSQQHFIKSTAM